MYVKGGENTFMPDTDDPQMPGKEGLKAIGGVVTHLQAAIGNKFDQVLAFGTFYFRYCECFCRS